MECISEAAKRRVREETSLSLQTGAGHPAEQLSYGTIPEHHQQNCRGKSRNATQHRNGIVSRVKMKDVKCVRYQPVGRIVDHVQRVGKFAQKKVKTTDHGSTINGKTMATATMS